MVLFRVDNTFEPLPWEKLSDGRYWGHIVLGKVGHKLPYKNISGQQWDEWVGEQGLFNQDYVKSLAGNPIVLTHPQSGRFNLNKDGLKVGHLTTRYGKEDDQLIMEAFIDDHRAIARIDEILAGGGVPEVSPGYAIAQLIPHEDGSFEQVRLYNDHIAAPLYPGFGRGGSDIRMRFDEVEVAVAEPLYFLLDSKKSMKLKINDRTFDVEDEALVGEIKVLQSRCDQLQADNQKLVSDYSRVEGESDGLKQKLDSLEQQKPTDEAIAEEIQQRLDVWALVLPEFRQDNKEFKPDFKLTAAEIKKAYLKHKLPDLKLDEKPLEYWEGRWDSMKPTPREKTEEAIDRADSLLEQLNQDMSMHGKGKNKEEDEKDIMKNIRDRYKNAHKKRKTGAMN